MRTTLDLDDTLLSRAREHARAERMTLTALVESALAAALAPRAEQGPEYAFRWEPHRGGRYLGGVDLADRRALYDVLEDGD
jgi:hypothetical protein